MLPSVYGTHVACEKVMKRLRFDEMVGVDAEHRKGGTFDSNRKVC